MGKIAKNVYLFLSLYISLIFFSKRICHFTKQPLLPSAFKKFNVRNTSKKLLKYSKVRYLSIFNNSFSLLIYLLVDLH